jgi:branched-chain amino acid transport system substrate-binding protein
MRADLFVGIGHFVSINLSLNITGSRCGKERQEGNRYRHEPALTGFSMVGIEPRRSYETAVADINKAGGVMVKEYGKKLPVRLIKVNKVDLLLGGFAAPFGVIPYCITAEKHKRYYHTSIWFIPPWLEDKFKWSTLFSFDFEQACSVLYKIWNTLPKEQRPQKPALIMEDTFDGRAFAGIFRGLAQKYGYKFALDEPWALGAKDYSAQIVKAKSLGVDAILIFGADADCITFIRQMKENDLSVKYMHGWKGTWAGEFYQALGKDGNYISAMILVHGFPTRMRENWVSVIMINSEILGERWGSYALCQILWQD